MIRLLRIVQEQLNLIQSMQKQGDEHFCKQAYFRRYQAYMKMEKLDEALADIEKLIELSPESSYQSKRRELQKKIDERNEKLKEEMLGKLKDVGNKILGKFGMSLDNFKMVQDPATGGYNIKFEKYNCLLTNTFILHLEQELQGENLLILQESDFRL